MGPTFILLMVVLVLAGGAGLLALGRAVSKPIGIVGLTIVALFCGYGFMASFEPSSGAIYFKIGYAAIGLLCLAAGAWLVRR